MSGGMFDLRSALHLHGAHLGREPAHGLQGGVVVTELGATAHEVFPLEHHHTAAVVRLWEQRKTKVSAGGADISL